MGKRQRHLSAEQIAEFRQVESQTRDVHELKRLQATRLYGSGKPIREIMEMVGVGESSVRQWAMAYGKEGLCGLRSKWQGQNANKLTPEQRQQLKENLHEYRPVDVGLSGNRFWTVEDVRLAVEHWFGVVYQESDSYRNLLHQSGLSYQRSSKVYRHRPSALQVSDFEAELEKK